jgi:hypothetical protein
MKGINKALLMETATPAISLAMTLATQPALAEGLFANSVCCLKFGASALCLTARDPQWEK